LYYLYYYYELSCFVDDYMQTLWTSWDFYHDKGTDKRLSKLIGNNQSSNGPPKKTKVGHEI